MMQARKTSHMALKKPTIVIFDMDGTSVQHLNPRLLHILERLDDFFYPLAKFVGWVFMRRAKGPILPPEETKERKKKRPRLLVHRAIHKFRRKPVEQIVKPSTAIYPMLQLLKEQNIPAALVSSGLGKGYGHDIVEKFGFGEYFGAFVFREDIGKSKPDPEPLFLALSRMGLELGADDVVWHIGDRHKDVKATLAADKISDAKFQPIACAVNAAAAVLESGLPPEHIIMNYVDIRKRLCMLLGVPDEHMPEIAATLPLKPVKEDA